MLKVTTLSFALILSTSAIAFAAETQHPVPQKSESLDPRIVTLYEEAQSKVDAAQIKNWQQMFLAATDKINSDWKESFKVWCGDRPACGLPPKVKKQNDISGPGRANDQGGRPNSRRLDKN